MIVLNHGQVAFDGDVDEGINKYLGISSRDDFPTAFDFTKNSRAPSVGNTVRVASCSFVNKEQAVFNNSNHILLRCRICSCIDVCDLRLLIKVYDSSKQCLGTILSNRVMIRGGDANDVVVRFQLKSLRPAVYFLNIELVETGESGAFVSLDNASATNVRLSLKNDGSHEILGDKRYYGYITLQNSDAFVECQNYT